MPAYAETHYKFRLPWSPLWRARPEAIVDAPCVAVPGEAVPLFLAVHDAHLFPRRLRRARVVVRAGGSVHVADFEPDLLLDRPFHFVDLPWPGPEIHGRNLVDVRFDLEDSKGRTQSFLNHAYPGLPAASLSVDRLPAPFPAPGGWVSADLHCHTTWSEDPVEWGGDPLAMRRAAKAAGLAFFTANDHSYDFAWDHPDWMRPADPHERFEAFRGSLGDAEDGLPPALACEEVSCGNSQGRNIHLIVCEHPEYIPGQGDGGRRWLRNRPDLSIPQVLDIAATSGAPAWAAHPRAPIGLVERAVFRRGAWSDADLDPRLLGLQFWNGRRGTDFTEGRRQWAGSLVRGSRFLPLAGNDAHGDLNRAVQVAAPLWSLRQTRAHRFAHARTWMHAGAAPRTRDGFRQLLASAPPTTVSDGPWLALRAPGAARAVERSAGGRIELDWRDLPGGDGLSEIRVYGHMRGSDREEMLLRIPLDGASEGHEELDAPAGLAWVRAELDGRPPFAGKDEPRKALTAAVEPG